MDDNLEVNVADDNDRKSLKEAWFSMLKRFKTQNAGVEVNPNGRTKGNDTHREHFRTKKQTAVNNSLPPPVVTKYKNVWPITINFNDGDKLVVGTLSCNVLVTSSIRIDRVETPVVGATMHMNLSQHSDSLSISIYLDKKSVELALNIAKNDKYKQLNAFFDDGSTYYLCRYSGPLTQSHTCHPYSVFTLFDSDMGRSSASNIFGVIAIEVLKKGNEAQLNKDVVSESLENCNNESISKVREEVLLLFNTSGLSIPILGNSVLNKHLQNLAILLHPYLTTANKSVQSAILQTFKYLD
ncbi:uncharacterized protein BX663DRAFT_546726 [Cokeromyces recurvatus]|uniref:uncharacterized protein n=1 Tax=Cokeromyces recurvatus TaxID=90255 RepID=UPI002220BF87|nr:uncharacterized protein BX663DRAFT_546726 [Cokeromyces recurvatus]KAI7898005.1 hypothetical protein BX663DRAFT_546726 [Cokeromyces recurvatus]